MRRSGEPDGAPPRWLSLAVLAAAVLIASTAAILIRIAQAQGVSSLSIAAWRLVIATLVLTPLLLGNAGARAEVAGLTSAQVRFAVLSGFFLALHFATWIASLAYTSVASSGALVASNPIWIALAAWFWFGEKLSPPLALGIAAALIGSALIFTADAGTTSAAAMPSLALLGNGLALTGSLAVCGYLLIGRKLRLSISLLPYIWLVYGAAAVSLALMALVSGAGLFDLSPTAWACVAGLALGPQLLAHSAFNWAVKHVSTTLIAVIILGEPIGSALWAWLLLGESFSPLQLAGFVVLLSGIFLASRAGRGD